jgi:uncharacterized protein YvpB
MVNPQGMLPPAPPKPGDRPERPERPEVHSKPGIVDVFTVLNVRSGPSTSHEILGTLQPGTVVKIVGEENGWFEILWRGRRAWVCGYYIWRPGEKMRNDDIREEIGRTFGQKAMPPRSAPPSPVNGKPGDFQRDGGLDIPILSQYSIGARVPSGFCGPTSLKMVLGYYNINRDINYLGDKDVGGATPVYIPGAGAGHQGMLDMLKHCGLKGSYMTHGKSISWLREQTRSGRPVIVSVKGDYGAGFVTSGHILVVSGVTDDGRVILNDSAGGKRRIVSGSQFLGAWGSSSRMAIVAQP